MPVTNITQDSAFQTHLNNAGASLVIVDFTASWCGPCQMIAPVFEQLSNRYTNAIFLKVDVDVCRTTASSQRVSAMPTFIFYRNKTAVGRLQGGDPVALENKITELIGSVVSTSGDHSCPVPGHMDLASMILKAQCECLNESDEHTFANCLTGDKSGYLESDCDEQLIISITFSQMIKLHSIVLKGPEDKGAKNVRLFINQPRTLDFDQASSMESVQDVELTKDQVVRGLPVPLRFVKFQNVQNLLMFVKDNQDGEDTTIIEHLQLIGTPVNTTNMSDFKRVGGEKGESHF